MPPGKKHPPRRLASPKPRFTQRHQRAGKALTTARRARDLDTIEEEGSASAAARPTSTAAERPAAERGFEWGSESWWSHRPSDEEFARWVAAGWRGDLVTGHWSWEPDQGASTSSSSGGAKCIRPNGRDALVGGRVAARPVAAYKRQLGART